MPVIPSVKIYNLYGTAIKIEKNAKNNPGGVPKGKFCLYLHKIFGKIPFGGVNPWIEEVCSNPAGDGVPVETFDRKCVNSGLSGGSR